MPFTVRPPPRRVWREGNAKVLTLCSSLRFGVDVAPEVQISDFSDDGTVDSLAVTVIALTATAETITARATLHALRVVAAIIAFAATTPAGRVGFVEHRLSAPATPPRSPEAASAM